jgi:cyanophycinase-like exopeptidase
MLHGGGSEDDAVFAVFVEAANFGNIVTLGALPQGDPAIPAWDPYWRRLGARTATTVNTASLADGDDPALAAVVREADALFLRGGDQAAYVAQWFGHAVGDALVEAFDRGAVIGGSSAGCAILGERLYDASAGGVTAWEVLRDGRDPWLTFTDNPGFGVRGVITDTHVGERGRLPRLAVFLAHQQQDRPDVRWQGLGVDTQTALFVREDRTGFMRGDGAVTLLRSGRATLTAGRPPDLRDVAFWSLPEGYAMDLDADDPVTSRPASVIATARVPASPFGETDLDGDWTGTNRLGSWQIEPWADPSALLEGRLQILPADAVLPSAIVGARVWSDDETLETRLGGLLWGIAAGDGRMAIAMDEGMFAMSLEPRALAVAPNQVALVVDARTASHRGTRATGWQVGALEGARLHLVGDAEPLNLR